MSFVIFVYSKAFQNSVSYLHSNICLWHSIRLIHMTIINRVVFWLGDMRSLKNKASNLKRYLDIGMRFSVVFKFANNEKYSTQCSFIGMKDKQFLIFELNSKAMEELITLKTNDVEVVLRGLADTEYGHIVAFRSKVLGIKSLATWLMFLRFPSWVETKVIRKHKRFKVNINTKVIYEGYKTEAIVQDISVSGCRLYFDKEVDMKPGKEIKLSSPLDYTPKPHPKCTVASCRRDGAGYSVGVNFEPRVKMTDKLKLEIYQLAQLAAEVD